MNKSTKLILTMAALSLSAAVMAGPNDGGAAPQNITATAYTGGRVLCTAAMNSDGTIAGGLGVNRTAGATTRLALGQYQVAFIAPCAPNITAFAGFSRWVQVDTLTSGSIGGGVSCTTADRAGVPAAVWVNCTDNTGANVDTSFFLFVAR